MKAPERQEAQALSESDSLAELVDRYLDGLLPAGEKAGFERRLFEPAVATAFGEGLLLRQLLQDMPPDEAPEALVEQLEAALGVDEDSLRRKALRLPRLQAALQGMGWMVKGPAQAVTQQPVPAGTPTASGSLSNMRYALGPIVPLAQARRKPQPKRPLWRRALGWRRKRRRRGER